MQVRGVQGRAVVCVFGFSVGQLVGAARVAPRRGVSCGRGAGDGCDGETDRGTSPILGAGQADAMAILMRRTLMRTSAPILRSLSRMVPQVACAKSVSWRPMRRRAHIRT